ncbi:hypothetical protein P3S68_027755 [Capsicum galapagoense]
MVEKSQLFLRYSKRLIRRKRRTVQEKIESKHALRMHMISKKHRRLVSNQTYFRGWYHGPTITCRYD